MRPACTTLWLAGSSVSLVLDGREEWAKETAGKQVFVSFMSPSCDGCGRLEEDLARLASDFAGSPMVGIYEVDCSAKGGLELCKEAGVVRTPELKYGDPRDIARLQAFVGDLRYRSFRAIADENLPHCRPDNPTTCTDADLASFARARGMTRSSLDTTIAETDKTITQGLREVGVEIARHLSDEARHRGKVRSFETKQGRAPRAQHEYEEDALEDAGAKLKRRATELERRRADLMRWRRESGLDVFLYVRSGLGSGTAQNEL